MTENLPDMASADPASAPTWRAAYSDRTAALMAAFAQLAYRPMEGEPPAQPGESLSELLAKAGFSLIACFQALDTQAYLAVRPDQFAVLAFRGTTDFADWKTNADLVRRRFELSDAYPIPINARRRQLERPIGPPVDVHQGFLAAYEAIGAAVRAAVDAHVPGNLGLYITGHSLGGALAQIASAKLERDNLAACYTFGSPRVGTADFDLLVKCPHYRVVNDNDVVPGVPLPTPWGYQHGGDGRLIRPDQHDQDILRKNRSLWFDIPIALFSLVFSLFGNRIFVVDQHMIWNYRGHLEKIATARVSRS